MTDAFASILAVFCGALAAPISVTSPPPNPDAMAVPDRYDAPALRLRQAEANDIEPLALRAYFSHKKFRDVPPDQPPQFQIQAGDSDSSGSSEHIPLPVDKRVERAQDVNEQFALERRAYSSKKKYWSDDLPPEPTGLIIQMRDVAPSSADVPLHERIHIAPTRKARSRQLPEEARGQDNV